MVIFLPLLFADGQPTSLERITQNQLEKFIPFMLSCCPESTFDVPPNWWLPYVPYKFPLVSPSTGSQKWFSCLKEIVCRCYEYHKCEHVLRFCSRLAELPSNALKYKESSQGFISIFNKTNNKLIVTFKKRNQIYDRQNLSPFKTLLPRKPSQPPREQHIEDIYLCNYCDEEFTSGKAIVAHEAICKGKVDQDASNNASLDQELFVRYFGLCPLNKSSKKLGTPSSKRGTSVRLTPKTYVQIPISSPLGLKMGANTCLLRTEDKMDSICKAEAHCRGKVWGTSQTKPRRFEWSGYRSSRRKKKDHWTHTYCFNRAQQREKKLTLQTGLNKRARLLLRKCKKAIVLVEKLPLLDPLALHAAASLHFHAESLKNDKKDHDVKRHESGILLPSSEKPSSDPQPVAVFVDLTCDEGITNHDELSLKENFCNNRSSSDIFFNSSSNHKRPPLQDWSATQPMRQFLFA